MFVCVLFFACPARVPRLGALVRPLGLAPSLNLLHSRLRMPNWSKAQDFSAFQRSQGCDLQARSETALARRKRLAAADYLITFVGNASNPALLSESAL